MITVISAAAVLGILIFVHELGHFLVAKRAGVGVTTFSLGFGPRLLGFKMGGTDYRLSAIPLGGFVRMVGENPGEDVSPEEEAESFSLKPVGWRLAIVAAGPLANVLFAVLAYYVVLVGWGVPTLTTQVGDVMAGKPAALAGVQKNDKVLAINGKPMNDWVHMVEAIQGSGGRPVHMVVQRGRQEIPLTVKPNQVEVTDIFGDKHQIYRVGIMASQDVFTRSVGLWDGVGLAFRKTYMAGELIIMSVVKIIQAKVSVDNIGGPIMIAQVAGQAASHGLGPFLNFAALISVNLAILNLLPIPALDGGHIFFFLIEAITRRPVSRKVREKAQQVGMAILMLLMAFVFYNDIARLLGGSAQ